MSSGQHLPGPTVAAVSTAGILLEISVYFSMMEGSASARTWVESGGGHEWRVSARREGREGGRVWRERERREEDKEVERGRAGGRAGGGGEGG